jgi:basic amino acid/polyamine antiporter, APA family
MQTRPSVLKQELGVTGAVLIGLGSILGTGVFVSLGVAAGVAGPSVVLAVAIAALVAICNGLSAAQLAANHPVSGGTYEYGYRYLNPWLGFTAGWLFLLAKSASAATAALGFAGYLLSSVGISNRDWLIPIALAAVLVLTLVALGGIRRSNRVNLFTVTLTLLCLGFFAIAGLVPFSAAGLSHFTSFFAASDPLPALFHATALMFVAYTGYGRITTMGEEVRSPRQTIPKAIVISMLVTMLIYLTIAVVGVGAVGAPELGNATQAAAPLELAARQFKIPGSSQILAIGAIVAMVGVLLNLILGLSRVLLAMGRRGDMPRPVARLNAAGTAPSIAVIVMGSTIGLLVLVGNVKTTWSFSAFTVLVYYALTNLAALQLSASERLYPAWVAWIGFAACLFLAFWVEPQIWRVGLGLIGLGLAWKAVMGSRNRRQ